MNRIPLEGLRFGRLAVNSLAEPIGKATAYHCSCDCGEQRIVRGQSLRLGDTTSCGCVRAEMMAAKQTTHGMYQTETYNSWRAMLARCYDSVHRQYKDYGGRGITVCPAWIKFEKFFADMGVRPKDKTLDRRDVNGNYEPDNCRWATSQEQNLNRRKTA